MPVSNLSNYFLEAYLKSGWTSEIELFVKTITYFAKSFILDWVLNMPLFFAVNFGAKREFYPSKTTLAIYQIGFHQIKLDYYQIAEYYKTLHKKWSWSSSSRSYLLKKSLMENFIFCAVKVPYNQLIFAWKSNLLSLVLLDDSYMATMALNWSKMETAEQH